MSGRLDGYANLPHLSVRSETLSNGRSVPRRHTADGGNVSPPLAWSVGPEGTKSYVVLCDDPDAPGRHVFHHWAAWNIPADVHALREGAARAEMREGENDFGEIGYRGPRPPSGERHRYVFRVLALDTAPTLPDGASREQLDTAIEGHVIATGELVAHAESTA